MKFMTTIAFFLISAKLLSSDFSTFDNAQSGNILGIGYTGVSRVSDDTYSFFINPALSSITNTDNIVSFKYGYTQAPYQENTYTKNFGLAINKRYDNWKFGAGIFHQNTNQGFEYDWDNLKKLSNRLNKNYNSGINLSASYGTKFKVGIGTNLKYVYEGDENNPSTTSDGMWAIDLGIFGSCQVFDKFKISDKLSWDLSVNAGISKTNIAPKYDFKGIEYSSYSHLGYSINTAMNYALKDEMIKLLGIEWYGEIFNTNSQNEFFDKTKFIKALLTLDENESTAGFKISAFESISYMYGFFGNKEFMVDNSYGIAVSSNGILKLLNNFTDNEMIKWLNKNIAIEYIYAKVNYNYNPMPVYLEKDYYNHNLQVTFKYLNLF